MAEKLDISAKVALSGLLPEGWGFYYFKGAMAIYEVLPCLDLTRKLMDYDINNEPKSFEINSVYVYCLYIGKNLIHWKGGDYHYITSSISLKGAICVVLIACKDYSLGCRTLFNLRTKFI